MTASTLNPITTRFLWKEYRTLRGFWLAVLVLGVIAQVVLLFLAHPSADKSSIAFGTGLACAVLFAVGAAAILFAVEREDDTYNFLSGLPMTWGPMFAGKLSVAAFSSVFLAAALTLTGALVAGRAPSTAQAGLLLGLFGIGLIEALAWGVLFSLLLSRPLTAVLWTLIVGSVAIHVAVNLAATSGTASLNLPAYSQAIPFRLAIAACVYTAAILVARGWLFLSPGQATTKNFTLRIPRPKLFRGLTLFRASSLRRGLPRLLWQTWRANWKMLVMPFGVAVLIYAGIVLIGGWIIGPDFAALVSTALAFLLPTLYGALAFGGDQRGRSYRFLAEHAAPPRFIWLSRHLFWLGSLVMLALIVVAAAAVAAIIGLEHATRQSLQHQYEWSQQSTYFLTRELNLSSNFVLIGATVASLGGLTAYALGQLCSMLLRSEILAAFTAVVLSVVLTAWVAMIVAWGLNAWLFLLPLFLGLMFATWLRAPDWLTERNSWRTWWKPALAMVLPVIAMAWLLPTMRNLPVEIRANGTAAATPEQRETAAMYIQAANLLSDPPGGDLLDRWAKPEYMEDGDPFFGLIDFEKIPAAERKEYIAAAKKQNELAAQARIDSAKLIVAASRRPNGRFDVDWSAAPPPNVHDASFRDREYDWRNVHAEFLRILELPLQLPLDEMSPQDAVEFQLASLRMFDQLRQQVPSAVAYRVLSAERDLLNQMFRWAANERIPTKQIRALLTGLEQFVREHPLDPTAPIEADRLVVRDVILGNASPLILDAKHPDSWSYLAFLANELPWERERALASLEVITESHKREANEFREFVYGGSDVHRLLLERWLPTRDDPRSAWTPDNYPLRRQAATSYLAEWEFDARTSLRYWYQQVVETETCRRAAILRLALLLYQRDHGEYPAELSDLAPKYLQHVPTDPFGSRSQPFSYSSTGFNAPIARYANWGLSSDQEIAAHTPVIWSAGPANVRPTQREVVTQVNEEFEMTAETETVTETFWYLEGDDNSWFWTISDPLIYPLPYIRPKPPEVPALESKEPPAASSEPESAE